jgi:hypothetical protein
MSIYVTNCWEGGREEGRGKLSFQCLRPFGPQTKSQLLSELFRRPSPSRKFRTLKTLRTRTQRVCLFTHLYCKEVNISEKNSEISIFSFLKSYYSLYKP